jgi:polyhydroxyalkanoate synthesis repressor PhaR
MKGKVLLKKYANRRLYDTEKSEYITLNEVTDMIRQGRQVEVIDAKTKEDVTAFILTQIILESAKTQNALLPPPILHLIIQYGDNILSEFFDKYLYQTINNYIAARSTFEDQYKKWLDLGADISGIAQKTFSDSFPFKSFMDMFSHSDKNPPHDSDKPQK